LEVDKTDGTNVLIVNSTSGNVGIGTTTGPNYKLEVAGKVKGNNVIIGGAETGVGHNGANMIDLGVGATREVNEGKIWYRASWDIDTLSIVGATASGTGTRAVRIWDCLGIGGTCTQSNGLYVSGNVGIGTTGPGMKLDVDGSAKFRESSFSVSGAATAIEETTTNLLASENGRPTSMTAGGTTPPTVTLISDTTGPFGDESWQIVFPANGDTGYAGSRATGNSFSITAGTTYSYNVWAKGDLSRVTIYFTGTYGSPALSQTGEEINGWYRYTTTGTVGLTGSQYVTVYLNQSTAETTTVYVVGVQAEQKSSPTSFVEGSRNKGDIFLTGALKSIGLGDSYFKGNVGIGNTGPDTELHIQGGLCVDTDAACTDPGDGNVYVVGNVDVDGSLSVAGDITDSTGATFGNIQIGITGDNEIDTTTGNLILDSAGGTVQITDNLDFDGATIDLSTQTVDVTLNDAVDALNFDSNTLSIDALNGRVGIGTAAPGAKLEVYNGEIAINRPVADSGYRQILFQDAGTTNWAIGQRNGDHKLHFYQAIAPTGTKMIIDNNGNVGIGTTGPNRKLEVSDSSGAYLRLTSSAGSAYEDMGGIEWYQPTGQAEVIAKIWSERGGTYYDQGDLRFLTNPGDNTATVGLTERVRITSTGNVGIGTTSPTAKLDVNGSINVTGSSAVLDMQSKNIINLAEPSSSSDAATKNYVDTQVSGGSYEQSGWNDTGTQVQLITSTDNVSANTLFVDNSNGRVGIGTTSSSEKLSVMGNVSLNNTLYVLENGNVGIGVTDPGSNKLMVDGGLTVLDDKAEIRGTNSKGDQLTILNDGNTQRGAGIVLKAYDSGSTYQTANISFDPDKKTLHIGDSFESSQLVINTSSGYVGIGTSTPESSLHIVNSGGDIFFERNAANSGSADLVLRKSRGSIGSPSIVQNDDSVGQVVGMGYDGVTYQNAAAIEFQIDKIPGNNNMPGRITFLTTPNSSTTVVERMRIDSSGNVGIGTASPSKKLVVNGTASALTFDGDSINPVINTTSGDMVISSNSGNVVVYIG
jgi:hypothetical protein